ncbi:UNVERIFIED_ORG: hypothetical protein QOE_0044 [Clostridioides difficile F501]
MLCKASTCDAFLAFWHANTHILFCLENDFCSSFVDVLHLYILDALQCEWFCSSALWFDRQERCGSLPPNKLCKRDFSRFCTGTGSI